MTDETGLRSLYEQYRDPLFRFAWRLTGSAEVAEDMVHDCFVAQFHGAFEATRGKRGTYLFAAVRNLVRKHYRDRGREDLNDDLDRLPVGSEDQLSALMARETSEAVKAAVEALPLLQREVLVLFEYEELPLEEIALIVEAEVGAVKSRLYRARERLRRSLVSAMKGVAK